MKQDWALEVRRTLRDPVQLCERLGLTKQAKRVAGGIMICCPMHGERTPSCSVTTGPDGTIRVWCFGCETGADALRLVAVVHGLDDRSQFAEVIAEAATLAGLHELASEARGGSKREARPLPPPPPARPAPEYPDVAEVRALWDSAGTCANDRYVDETLRHRSISAAEVDRRGLARAIKGTQALPPWARFEGKSWVVTGHRLVLRVFDAGGMFRSVRAWRTLENDTPKRLPPAGKRASALVLANGLAVRMLRRLVCPMRLEIVEGEPDFLTLATCVDYAVIGIGSGSWNEQFAARVPARCEVLIRTHNDPAGDKYADKIAATLVDRCPIWRAA